jgi:hypothetical protein
MGQQRTSTKPRWQPWVHLTLIVQHGKTPRELKGKYHPLGKSTLQWTYLDVTNAKFSRLDTYY